MCISFVDSSSTCSVHLINDGVTINGNNILVEFTETGPVNSCVCFIDNMKSQPCKLILTISIIKFLILGNSPMLFSDLEPGTHEIMIKPVGCHNRHRIPLKYSTIIENSSN